MIHPRKSIVAVAVCVIVTVIGVSGQAAIIHVTGDQPTIQAGIDAAQAGDTVLVACGTYYERLVTMKSGVCLLGETGQAECVVIDAEGQNKVFICDYVDETTRIEGVTIKGGYLMTHIMNYGAGMTCSGASPVIVNCDFVGNISTGTYPGGAGIRACNGSPVLINCRFINNHVTGDVGGHPGEGGGISYWGETGTVTIIDCEFSGNVALGGAINISTDASVMISGCSFAGNGGIGTLMLGGGGSFTVTDCVIARNSTGGLDIYWAPSVLVANCSIVENGEWGILGSSDSNVLENNIIAFNHDLGFEAMGSSPAMTCNDIFGNEGGDWVGNIANQLGIGGNISADPQFCGIPDSGNYLLQSDSPCAPGNHPDGVDCGLMGALPVGCGSTSIEISSWSAVKALY